MARFKTENPNTDRVQRFAKDGFQWITEIQSTTGEVPTPGDESQTIETITITRNIADYVQFS